MQHFDLHSKVCATANFFRFTYSSHYVSAPRLYRQVLFYLSQYRRGRKQRYFRFKQHCVVTGPRYTLIMFGVFPEKVN